MQKSLISALAIALSLTPAALAAEGTKITVQITYEDALLASEDGARKVLSSIKHQAKDACSYQTSIASGRMIDYACAKSITKDSITKIVVKRASAGVETAPNFLKRADFQVASLEQR